MKLQRISPILWTKDLQQTVIFYESLLGFSSQSNFPNFVSLSRDNVELMFIVPQNDSDEPDEEFFSKPLLTGSLFILADDVDDLWNRIKQRVTVKTELADREYMMRDFSILDNNGYELVFGKDIS